jgi:hypothetical protein
LLITPITFEDIENPRLLPQRLQRLVGGCVAFFSALGLLLAVVGLFGGVSYSESERKKK